MMEPIVWVFIASLVVWAGIFFYLIILERRLGRLEKASKRDGLREGRP